MQGFLEMRWMKLVLKEGRFDVMRFQRITDMKREMPVGRTFLSATELVGQTYLFVLYNTTQ